MENGRRIRGQAHDPDIRYASNCEHEHSDGKARSDIANPH
jgi:hypothetical protein